MPLFDEQDVVGESCATQSFDADMTAIVLPRFPRHEQDEYGNVRIQQQFAGEEEQDDENAGPLTPTAWSALSIMAPKQEAADSANLNAHAMQRLHLQTPRKEDKKDSVERRRGCGGDESIVSETPGTAWKAATRKDGKRSRSSSSSPCASAIVLARKRALYENWRKRQSAMTPARQERNRFIYDEDDDRARIGDEDDEECSETLQLASFVEYDYLGDASEDGEDPEGRQPMDDDDEIDDVSQSLQQQSCSFVDFRDLTQFNEEASEVFDADCSLLLCGHPSDVVYAPKRESTPPLTLNMPSIREETRLDDKAPSNSLFQRRGFDITPAVEDQSPVAAKKCELKEPQWHERRSVKRDCTFIDGGCSSPMFEHATSPRSTMKALGCRSIDTVPRIEELKADCIDSSDDFKDSPTKCTTTTYNSSSVTTLSSSSTANRELQPFQPRLLKKRKQARQLGFESFFRSRPCTERASRRATKQSRRESDRMAYVTLTNITVLDNPTAFTNPFQFEVTFECAHALEDEGWPDAMCVRMFVATEADLEWKITYVGSAEDESRDQILEEVLVGPVPVGTNKFVFQSDPPNPDMIPDEDKVGVTVVLVTCSYRGREFVRVGYYVNNDYADPFLLENPPNRVDITKLQRNILADKPRVTRFPIDWTPAGARDGDAMMDNDGNAAAGVAVANGVDLAMDFVDDEELVKAAAQLDHNYTDIVIGGGNGQGDQEEDIDLEDDEDDDDSVEEAEEEDADGDQEMEEEDIDLDEDL
ncbi:Histone chaperone asf1-like protein, partial [Globisporangium splendens]